MEYQTDKDKLVCVKTEVGKLIAYDKQLDVTVVEMKNHIQDQYEIDEPIHSISW